MPESPCQRYGLLRLPKVTERRDGPRPGDNDDDVIADLWPEISIALWSRVQAVNAVTLDYPRDGYPT